MSICSTSDSIFHHNLTSIPSANYASRDVMAAAASRVAELQCSLTKGCLDEEERPHDYVKVNLLYDKLHLFYFLTSIKLKLHKHWYQFLNFSDCTGERNVCKQREVNVTKYLNVLHNFLMLPLRGATCALIAGNRLHFCCQAGVGWSIQNYQIPENFLQRQELLLKCENDIWNYIQ